MDRILWEHESQPHIYDISSMLRPGSIRDQIIRGRRIVHRAIERGVISTARPMLVVGAGAAGVAAALEATAHGVAVVVIDFWRKPFRRQRRCITRRVDPTLYDWPAVQWRRAGYPWLVGDKPPLAVMPGNGRELALAWEARFTTVMSAQRLLLTWKPQTTVQEVSELAGGIRTVRLSDGSVGTYGAIVLARGPGKEDVGLGAGQFCSYAFWDTDRITRGELAGRSILISGGGDGALQDFLRCVLVPRADLRRLMLMLDVPVALQQELHALNDLSITDFVWSTHTRHEHDADAFLHREYNE
ncbi:MAG TPA: FAD-dependent oxidoreductase, partial [Thermoanaerobaculia bacterium]|nr:FAD-dependent oxidoreductase [Thermoanaerobaculia bacterium]